MSTASKSTYNQAEGDDLPEIILICFGTLKLNIIQQIRVNDFASWSVQQPQNNNQKPKRLLQIHIHMLLVEKKIFRRHFTPVSNIVNPIPCGIKWRLTRT